MQVHECEDECECTRTFQIIKKEAIASFLYMYKYFYQIWFTISAIGR